MKTIVHLLWLKVRLRGVSLWTVLLIAPFNLTLAARGPSFRLFMIATLVFSALTVEGGTHSLAAAPSFQGMGLSRYRSLPATWRQIAAASILYWAIPLGIAVLASLPAHFYQFDVLERVSSQGGLTDRRWNLDLVGAWALSLPAVVVGARMSRLGIRLRSLVTHNLVTWGSIAILFLPALVTEVPVLRMFLGIALSALVFVIPDRWVAAMMRARSAGDRTEPISSRLEVPVPTARPLLRLWRTRMKFELVATPLILLVVPLTQILVTRSILGRIDVDSATLVPLLPLLPLLFGIVDSPVMNVRAVVVRLPVSSTNIGTTGLVAGSVVGALFGAVALVGLLLRTSINPRLEALGGVDARAYAALTALAIFAVVTISHLARVAPVGSCPHYRKVAAVTVVPFCFAGIMPCLPALLIAVTCIHLAMGAVILARIGRLRRVR